MLEKAKLALKYIVFLRNIFYTFLERWWHQTLASNGSNAD